jgi:hypothetical protein
MPDWASTLRYNLPISFAKDKDIHTAMFLAGTGAIDMVMCAIREYITAHPGETGNAIDPVVQQQVAAAGLAIAMGIQAVKPLAPIPTVPVTPVWANPPTTGAVPVPNQTYQAAPDDMVSRLRSAIPTTQEEPSLQKKAGSSITPPASTPAPIVRTGMVSDMSFPDDIDIAPSESDESRRLKAAHQFAINQLKDA